MLIGRRSRSVFAALACVALSASAAVALPGDVDNGFGTNGRVITDIGRDIGLLDTVLRPDGKTIVLGWNVDSDGGSFVVARYTPGGALDPTFTGGGYGIIEVPGSGFPVAIAMQGSKIVILGQAVNSSVDRIAVLLRLTPSGGLDPSFGGGDGMVTRELPDGFLPAGLVVQTGGAIVVAGNADLPSPPDMLAVRFQPDGAVDASFGTGGVATVGVPGQADEATSVALQPDGRIVVGGTTSDTSLDFIAGRLLPGGDPDGSFGSSGVAIAQFASDEDDAPRAVTVQPNGKIVLAGYYEAAPADHEVAVARFNANGTLDNNFAGDGKFSLDIKDGYNDSAYDVVSHTGGTILVAGRAPQPPSNEDGILLRLTPGGVLDGNFSSDGKIVENWDPDHANYRSIAVRRDGSVVVGADLGTDGGPLYFGLARYRDRGASAVSLDIARTKSKVKASGEVVPDSKSGQKVKVTLFKQKSGRWKRVARKNLTLNAQSAYRTAFKRPAAKRCRVDAAYGGDALHRPSKRTKKFAC